MLGQGADQRGNLWTGEERQTHLRHLCEHFTGTQTQNAERLCFCREWEQRVVAARQEADEKAAAVGRQHQRELEAVREKYETGQVCREAG